MFFYKNKKDYSVIMKILNDFSLKDNLRIKDLNSNLFFFGDNLNCLLTLIKSGYTGMVDLIYIDPPYNTGQTFLVNEDRSSTISMIKNQESEIAYKDDRKMEDYLEFIRERLFMMKELLSEQGSIYFHIDGKIGHYIKIIMDEVFGFDNFKNDISRVKSNPKNFGRKAYGNEKDMILFYAKNAKKNIFNNITIPLTESEKESNFHKIDKDGRRYNTIPIHAPGETLNGDTGKEWKGMLPPKGRHWRVSPLELDRLDNENLIEWSSNGVPRLKKYADEHKGKKIQDIWIFKDPAYPVYPTEKNMDMLEMIIKQSSNPSSIVLDCFAGSGSTLKTAEKLGRKWIGADISPVSLRIMEKAIENNELSGEIIHI